MLFFLLGSYNSPQRMNGNRAWLGSRLSLLLKTGGQDCVLLFSEAVGVSVAARGTRSHQDQANHAMQVSARPAPPRPRPRPGLPGKTVFPTALEWSF